MRKKKRGIRLYVLQQQRVFDNGGCLEFGSATMVRLYNARMVLVQ